MKLTFVTKWKLHGLKVAAWGIKNAGHCQFPQGGRFWRRADPETDLWVIGYVPLSVKVHEVSRGLCVECIEFHRDVGVADSAWNGERLFIIRDEDFTLCCGQEDVLLIWIKRSCTKGKLQKNLNVKNVGLFLNILSAKG